MGGGEEELAKEGEGWVRAKASSSNTIQVNFFSLLPEVFNGDNG